VNAIAQTNPRWWRYVHRKQLVCPAGHHYKNSVKFNPTGFIQCPHWIAGEQRECGVWVFAFAIEGGRAIVAEVTEDESSAMEELRTPGAMIDYLGIFEPSALARISAPIGSPPASRLPAPAARRTL
jgi:hypothetical protein